MITGVSNLQYGAGGIVAIVILAVLFGWLIPRWTVNQIVKSKDKEIDQKDKQLAAKDKENELLRQAVDNYRLANDRVMEYSNSLLSVSQVTTKALHALTASAHQGEPDEVALVKAPSKD